jgi:NAD(P)-dependent dehydrogenase (short-subunit alcohol dehydrogenase family)
MGGVLVVTGGSRGIGAATAQLAAGRGWAVAVNYLSRADAAGAVVASIRDRGGQAIAVQADVSTQDGAAALFATARSALGPVTGLVNNAGIVARQGRVEDFTAERLERMWAVNVTSAFLCAREAVLAMSTRHGGSGGSIVNVSSRAAVLGSPGVYVDYAASKAAVDTLTTGLATEVAGEGIRVNAVRPGVIRTEIHASGGEPGRVDRMAPAVPMGRGGEPSEVAEAILWLLSDAASYTTGAFLDVSGGR